MAAYSTKFPLINVAKSPAISKVNEVNEKNDYEELLDLSEMRTPRTDLYT